MTDTDPVAETVERWHAFVRGDTDGTVRDLLHPDVVFWSPVVFRPQEGIELTAMYLEAAFQVFPGDGADAADAGEEDATGGGFRYVREVIDGHTAVLEFETAMGGIHVNGVDIITCGDDGRIVEFKVMLRPQKAVEAARERMGALLS